MASVERIERNLLFSIARLAAEFKKGRDTVAKILAAANVPAAEMRHGHPVYRLIDVAALLVDRPRGCAGDEEFDPRDLPPKERKDWFNSEESRLTVETRARRLIPAAEVEVEYAELVKGLVQFIDTLPDVLERKAKLSPEQAELAGEVLTEQRQALFDRIAGDMPPEQATG